MILYLYDPGRPFIPSTQFGAPRMAQALSWGPIQATHMESASLFAPPPSTCQECRVKKVSSCPQDLAVRVKPHVRTQGPPEKGPL